MTSLTRQKWRRPIVMCGGGKSPAAIQLRNVCRQILKRSTSSRNLKKSDIINLISCIVPSSKSSPNPAQCAPPARFLAQVSRAAIRQQAPRTHRGRNRVCAVRAPPWRLPLCIASLFGWANYSLRRRFHRPLLRGEPQRSNQRGSVGPTQGSSRLLSKRFTKSN